MSHQSKGLPADVILRKAFGSDGADRQTEMERPMKDSNWGLAVGLKHYCMAPSGRELAPKATEGACVKRRFLRILLLNFRKYSFFLA